jgi:nucleoside-diphosphate-sugar epimerase
MGLRVPLIRVPDPIARGAGVLFERVYKAFGAPKPLFTEANVKLCDIDHYFRIDRARHDLGYEPRIDTVEGLRRTAVEAREYYESL